MWDDDEHFFYGHRREEPLEPASHHYELITPGQKMHRIEFSSNYSIQRRPTGKIRFSKLEL